MKKEEESCQSWSEFKDSELAVAIGELTTRLDQCIAAMAPISRWKDETLPDEAVELARRIVDILGDKPATRITVLGALLSFDLKMLRDIAAGGRIQ